MIALLFRPHHLLNRLLPGPQEDQLELIEYRPLLGGMGLAQEVLIIQTCLSQGGSEKPHISIIAKSNGTQDINLLQFVLCINSCNIFLQNSSITMDHIIIIMMRVDSYFCSCPQTSLSLACLGKMPIGNNAREFSSCCLLSSPL